MWGSGAAKVTASATAGCSNRISSTLRRSDLLAAAIDDLARTTDQKEIAVFIEEPDIAGLEPLSSNAAYVADANADGGPRISPPAKLASIPAAFEDF
jgi:hypothetical protein